MPEITTLTQTVQIGAETTPGTSVAANKKLNSISIEPAIQVDVDIFRPMGVKYPTLAAIGREWTEAALPGRLSYTEIVYILSSVLKKVTPVQISPPSGQAYRWTFTPSQTSEDTPQTFTVEIGSSARAQKFTYGIVRDFNFRITRERTETGGTMIGRAVQDGITMTASPTEIALVPILPKQVDVYIDTSAASIGTTKMTRAIGTIEFSITNRYGLVWPFDSSLSDFAAHIEVEPEVTLALTLAADASGMGPLTALRQAAKRFIRIKATGDLIETGNPYSFQLDLCGVVAEVNGFSDENGIRAIGWTFRSVYDSGWGKPFEIQVINNLSSL